MTARKGRQQAVLNVPRRVLTVQLPQRLYDLLEASAYAQQVSVTRRTIEILQEWEAAHSGNTDKF